MHFSDRLAEAIHAKNSCLMLGLDPNWGKLPKHLKAGESLQAKADVYQQFCCDMVDACAAKVCGIKIQMGYFEALGSVGVKAVENIVAYARKAYPDLIIMMDAKRGDIGSTSEAYAQAFLGEGSPLAGDAVTVSPYMGTDSLAPFGISAMKGGKGIFVLVKTSNKGSKQIQDLRVGFTTLAKRWANILEGIEREMLADSERRGRFSQNSYSCFGAVVGATHGKELKSFRKILKTTWILAPGVGAQGGKLEDVLTIRDEDGLGVLVPVSRSVLYAGNGEDYLAASKAEITKLWEAQKM